MPTHAILAQHMLGTPKSCLTARTALSSSQERCSDSGLTSCHPGVVDGYWEYRLKPWDMAAGVIIAQEAGAMITQMVRGSSTAGHICPCLPAGHVWCMDRMSTSYLPGASSGYLDLDSGGCSVKCHCDALASRAGRGVQYR